MNKKTEYSKSLVMMVIFLLALPIALPPFFRVMFPADEDTGTSDVVREYLFCSKTSEDGVYNASSSTLYEDYVPIKNTISFYYVTNEVQERRDINTPVIQYNEDEYYEEEYEDDYVEEEYEDESEDEYVEEEFEDEFVVGESGDIEVVYPTRTVAEEIEFFKSVEGINFQQSDIGISLEVTEESIQLNPNNLELGFYFADSFGQQEFYEKLGYTCYYEET